MNYRTFFSFVVSLEKRKQLMVKIEKLSKKYGSHEAVSNISFTMESGTIYGLLGPNGAGKSTTMNMMTGYLAPSSGSVEINGISMDSDAKNVKKHLGYLPENPPLYPDMTVHEYLVFVAELKGVDKKDRLLEVEGVMDDVGITDVSDRLIKNLSKGYKQRVGLAGAMLSEPDVLILDEPTVGLDPKQILDFRELIKSLSKERIIMISSHILSEISAICDHVFIINGGRLVVDDDVKNLDKYASEDTIITITVKGDANLAVSILEKLDGVKSVEIENTQDDSSSLKVNTDSKDGMTEEISLALMEARIPILGMSEEKGSLEQIFLEITGEETAPLTVDETDESSESADFDDNIEYDFESEDTDNLDDHEENEDSKEEEA